jgi:hypothetical protein
MFMMLKKLLGTTLEVEPTQISFPTWKPLHTNHDRKRSQKHMNTIPNLG